MRLLTRLNQAGQTVVVITHCTWAAAECARRVILMDEGRIAADVTPRELFASPELLTETGQVAPATARFSQARAGRTLLSVRETLDSLRLSGTEVEA